MHDRDVTSRWTVLDRSTQLWVRATGTKIHFTDHPWLLGPAGDEPRVGHTWVGREAERIDGVLREGGGLLPDIAALGGADFDPDALAQPIIDFYQQTSGWRLEVWSQWSAAAWPFGWLISALFARRLDQLSLPLRPLDTARGLDSRVVSAHASDGTQQGAAWIRTLRATGETVYSGWYGIARLPGKLRPSVRVVFPLPNGSLTILLRPENGTRGSLRLVSPLGRFGDDGAYLVVRDPAAPEAWARRVPLAEEFSVFVDDEGVLRTDHALDLWRIPALRLHYRIDRRLPTP